MSLLDAPPAPHYFTPEHEQFRASLRAWVAAEITPHVNEWDEAETFPRELYRKASARPSSRSLLLGIRIARATGDRDAEASYALQLKGFFPDSEEYRSYQAMPPAR